MKLFSVFTSTLYCRKPNMTLYIFQPYDYHIQSVQQYERENFQSTIKCLYHTMAEENIYKSIWLDRYMGYIKPLYSCLPWYLSKLKDLFGITAFTRGLLVDYSLRII